MIQLGMLDVAYDDRNRLRPTPYGMRVLRGEERVMLAKYTERQEAGKRTMQSGGAGMARRLRRLWHG